MQSPLESIHLAQRPNKLIMYLSIREGHNNSRVNEIIKDAADIITLIQYFRESGFNSVSVSTLPAY